MKKNKNLVVCYATDENYTKLVWCSLKSLLETNKTFFDSIKIYIISDNISTNSLNKFLEFELNYNCNLEFIDFEKINYGIENACSFQNGKTTYARLFIEKKIKEDKVLYLDCDTIINDSLFQLWNTDMGNSYIAGVLDLIAPQLKSGIGLSPHDLYINAGVLLINLKEWKKQNLEDSFVSYIKKKNGIIPCHDQGILNHVCKNHIKVIDCKYNTMTPLFYFSSSKIKKMFSLPQYYSDEEIKEATSKPTIIHFTAGWEVRVWNINSHHPYSQLFRKYYYISPWKNIPLKRGKLKIKVIILKTLYKMLPFFAYNILVNIKRKSHKE